jgi:hypothetical protein
MEEGQKLETWTTGQDRQLEECKETRERIASYAALGSVGEGSSS